MVKLYPNPTTGLLYISQPSSNEPILMQIYDSSGKLKLVKNDIRTTNTIDMSSFVNGIYFVKIFSTEFGDSVDKVILK